MARKVVIDTDPGVDDAMGIMMALEAQRRGQLEIVAFTLAEGNCGIEDQIRNMGAIMSFYPEYKDIPIFRGPSEGMVRKYKFEGPHFHGSDGFNDIAHGRTTDGISLVEGESAALALVRLSKQHDGELYVVCFAPLTNVALAMKVDEGFAGRIKQLYVMGGNAEARGNCAISAEFNFHADPEAAFVTLRHAKTPIVLVTWELCAFYLTIPIAWREDVFGSIDDDRVRFLNALERPWYDGFRRSSWIPCDQLIMAVFLDDACVTARRSYWATVELSGEVTRGQMVIEKRTAQRAATPPDNVDVITELDKDRVCALFMSTFS